MLYISLRQLEYITAIAREGSLKRASDVLNVSQPSLSVALAKLETHLDQRLFLRGQGRAISLTSFGRDYVARAEGMLAQAAALDGQKPVEGAGRGELVLGCFSDLAPNHIGSALSRLSDTLPEVEVSFEIGGFSDIAEMLQSGRCDLAITYDIGLDARFERSSWYEAVPSAFLAADHSLAGRKSVGLSDLQNDALILSDEGLSQQHFLNLFHKQGLRPVVQHRTASLEVMRSLAANGAGVGLSYTTPPASMSYDGKQLISVPIEDVACREPVVIAVLKEQAGDPWLQGAVRALLGQVPS